MEEQKPRPRARCVMKLTSAWWTPGTRSKASRTVDVHEEHDIPDTCSVWCAFRHESSRERQQNTTTKEKETEADRERERERERENERKGEEVNIPPARSRSPFVAVLQVDLVRLPVGGCNDTRVKGNQISTAKHQLTKYGWAMTRMQ